MNCTREEGQRMVQPKYCGNKKSKEDNEINNQNNSWNDIPSQNYRRSFHMDCTPENHGMDQPNTFW